MRIEPQDGIALLTMREGKANAVGPAFLASLSAALDELTRLAPSAAVITGYEGFFSAGLDLPALLPLDRPAMQELIETFSAVMLRVFELPFPVVAAVNGHAVAGGCVLALQADWRSMADDDGRIGLKEVALGIGLPSVVVETLRCQVPAASLLPIALEARLLAAREAFAAGLVHEVLPPDELLAGALAKARSLAALPSLAFAQVKRCLRAPAAEAVRALGGAESARWLDTWFSEEGRRLVGRTVEDLARRRPPS
jgi:enoyl-CoA hydratase